MAKKIKGDSHPNQIVFFDPGCASANTGDQIISISARKWLEPLFPTMFVNTVSSHQKTSWRYRRLLNESALSFVLGSNLLQSDMLTGFRQWDISLVDTLQLQGVILVGCGWKAYGNNPSIYTKLLYKQILSHKYYHSVRDEFTKHKLNEAGITNVINTGCPSLWQLTEEHCAAIPIDISDTVVTTLTDYSVDYQQDEFMLNTLCRVYRNVYIWPQGMGDYGYVKELPSYPNCKILPSGLESFDNFLDKTRCDYVGTRLHGGIRALQHGRRTLIISIDNRAREMAHDYGLPILERSDMDHLEKAVKMNRRTEIHLAKDRIKQFLSQFVNLI